MRPATILVPAAPIVAALLALACVAGLGLSQRSDLPAAIEPLFYGFFLDRYPLYAFALVYGIVRIMAAASGPGPASLPRRAVWGLAGILLLLAASLYPTFGGIVLRGGFMTGGVAFLSHLPMWLAYMIGAAVAAILFGAVTGLSVVLANRRLRPRAGCWPAIRRAGATVLLSFLALWFAAALIGLARDEGIGPWPRRAFTLGEALSAAGLILLASLPHALVGAFRIARQPA